MRTTCILLMVLSPLACGQPAATVTRSQVLEVIAHRGVHPFYYGEHDIDRQTGCSAVLLRESDPPFIENSMPSMAAAFAAGATMIEIDVHRTLDGQLVAFHDAGLACRTNGRGRPEDSTLDALKALDAGYGYTSDGISFPLRGRGFGLIPSVREVLDRFPNGRFIFDDKAGNARLIGDLLSSYSPDKQRNVVYWGDRQGYALVRAKAPAIGVRLMTVEEMMACRRALMLRAGLGSLPGACRTGVMIIPSDNLRPWYARIALGWPSRFLAKVSAAGCHIFIATDSPAEAVALSRLPIDGIMTDRIQVVGPLLRGSK
jgi:glycerophosphoryl diester phosphodiesterase